MLDVYESFLENENLFQSIHFYSRNFDKNIEKIEIEKIFILDFFQLQTIASIGIDCQYGCLENQKFIELVKFFHTLFPSLSIEKIYTITENQYLFLKKETKLK